MFALALIFGLFPLSPAFAGDSRCDGLKAESIELAARAPVACDESRAVHAAYLKAFPEVLETCRKIENEVTGGEPKLALGTETEMQIQVMETKQRHIMERRDLDNHVLLDLLPTPLDTNTDYTRLPLQVSSECGTEIELHVNFRRQVLDSIRELYVKLDKIDDSLFAQASDRALPAQADPRTPASAAPLRKVR